MQAYRKLFIVTVVSVGICLGITGVGGPLSGRLLSSAAAADLPTTVLVLQHAERHEYTKTDPDPELTAEGKQRAQDLVHVVGNAGVAAIFAPKAKRMAQTVRPLQQALKLSELHDYDQGSLKAMLQRIGDQYKGKVALVVGGGSHMGGGGIHDVINGLGCTGDECAFKDSNDNLIVVTVYGPGKATAVKLRYGKPVQP